MRAGLAEHRIRNLGGDLGLAARLPALACGAFLLCLPASAAAGSGAEVVGEDLSGVFRRLSVEDGLSHTNVYSILQDGHGFTWIATQDGLDRYDGYRVGRPVHDGSDGQRLAAMSASYLLRDSRGFLWIGTWGGGLHRFDSSTGSVETFRHRADDASSLSDDRVHMVLEDSGGRLWVATYRGLNLWRPESAEFVRFLADPEDPRSLGHDRIWSLAEDTDGSLWLGTSGGLDHFRPAPEPVSLPRIAHHVHDPADPSSLSHDLVRVVFRDRRGELWAGTEQGLNRLDRSSGTFQRLFFDPGGSRSDTINAIFEDHRGVLWIGTQGGGLIRYDRDAEQLSRFRHDPADPSSLGSSDVRTFFEDGSEILWIGTRYGGVSMLDLKPRKFQLDLRGLKVTTLFEDRRGAIWVGTVAGLFRLRSEDGGRVHFRHDPDHPNSLLHNSVKAVVEDRDGRLWVGTYQGLQRLDRQSESFVSYVHDPGIPSSLPNDRIESLLIDRRERLWVGTREGLSRYEPRTDDFVHHRHDDRDPHSLSENWINILFEDRDGTMWVGTHGRGLNRFDPETGRAERFRHDPADPNSLSDHHVTAIYQDYSGGLWICTGKGLNLYDPANGSFEHFGSADGLPHDHISGIVEDGRGHLWISSFGGLSRLDPETGDLHTFHEDDGLQGRFFFRGAALRTSQGELLFGGDQGLNRFFPYRIRFNEHAPPVVLTGFSVFNQPYDLGRPMQEVDEIVLSHEHTFFSFEFAALDYTSPQNNSYSYRLEGVDPGWVDAGHRRYAIYTSVPPGDYRFRVRAANSDGFWNEEGVSVVVRVLPPFWQTWWFRTAGVLLGAALVWTAHRLRLRGIRRTKERLEAEVRRRVRQVRKKNQQLQIIDTAVRLINEEVDFSELLLAILEGVSFVVAAEWGLALIPGQKSQRLKLGASFNWLERRLHVPELSAAELEERFLCRASEIAPGIFVGPSGDSRLRPVEEELGGISKAVLVMHIEIDGETAGYLVFGNTKDENAFVGDDPGDLENLRQHVASAFIKGHLLAELRDLNDKKNEFLGMAAHDLRSPLSGVKGYTELLLRMLEEDRFDKSLWRKFLENVRTTVDHMHSLVNDLLDVAAIETGRIQLRIQRQKMSDLLEERRSLHQSSARAKDIELLVEDRTTDIEVLMDRERAGEILDNLVTNAVKFTAPGGRVRIFCEDRGSELLTHIEDTGQGIDSDELPKVFLGRKLSVRPTSGEPSTGLGLVIVKKLVELQGGRVWVASEKGKGSTFTFSLPTPGA